MKLSRILDLKLLILVAYVSEMAIIILLGNSCQPSTQQEERAFSGDTVALTRSWESAIPNQDVPEGLKTLRASECGTCHIEIYDEWQRSVHAIAFQDLQFQSEWKKDNVYVCLNCHTPLQNQQEQIVVGLLDGDHKYPVTKANNRFDKILKMESITCATCHVREGAVIGTKGYPGSPHAVKIDQQFLSEQICFSCHNINEELNPSLVCTFETGNEWLASSRPAEGLNCISCHMPLVNRPISENGESHISHRHHFPGSGIPKFPGKPIEGLQGLEIKADKLVSSDFKMGDTLHFDLMIRNSFAGHSLPTGDPERFYLINFKLLDQKENILDSLEFRIGEEWQWYPEAKKISDSNLKPMEERRYQYNPELRVPGDLILKVVITKHRITKENVEYNKLPADYPRFITIFNRSFQFTVKDG